MITSGVEQPEWALLTFAINHIFIFLARRLFEGRGRGRGSWRRRFRCSNILISYRSEQMRDLATLEPGDDVL